ncbi:MAG TPA: lmo0937 family membrane protein [Gemmatimonadota bacterium]|nr:lmo0937 family membrane protein [Gemmatimonadota bacterium]
MLYTIIVILLVLWLLGGFVRPVGGFIHLLLVVILILFLIQLLG